MEGHTGNYSPPFHCITAKFHLLLDYVRAVAYAGGRLFSAGDDKTVSVSAILQTCSHHLVLQVRMWETVHHDCIRVLTGISCARCAGFVLMLVV